MEHTIRIIAAFVCNVHFKRALYEIDRDPHLNFWRMIQGNCLDIAVIEWCKLFGSDNKSYQPAHWKIQVPYKEHDGFRRRLLGALKLSEEAWEDYWVEVKGYRDNHAAHFNQNYLNKPDSRYPELTTALEAAYFYYEYLIDSIADENVKRGYPEDIKDYCERFASQASHVGRVAIEATSEIQEKVF